MLILSIKEEETPGFLNGRLLLHVPQSNHSESHSQEEKNSLSVTLFDVIGSQHSQGEGDAHWEAPASPPPMQGLQWQNVLSPEREREEKK